ncbi:glutathione S-transferase family protein [Pseudovibrio sp. Tun.PSC04-5.I4]|uniref:glutathione S-transferase family protein n=1 Tax=Pseudovibrio sp. Tun.PSC04-5.I4 TaxID=1798213 RepID=UPI0008869DC0|nr:glutathione S-transferase family protein [Pseudovibrio sp. Tun.PSC04-5.I4]SDQ32164.1 glutathione S-transferase [Pseudovibrio sp. Tun.PSC04-5.I4]
MKFKLVSYNLCPFVQQVFIALSLKDLDFDIEYIDLLSPPTWFTKASPLKKVPILFAGANQVLFESIAIIEFIEDYAELKTYPSNLFERSRDRAWIQFINQLMWSLYDLSIKGSEEEYSSTVGELHKKLDELEAASNGGKYLFGDSFSLVEAAIAPLLLRLNYIDEVAPGLLDMKRHSNICRANYELMADTNVRRSIHTDLKQAYYKLLGKRQGYLSAFLHDKFKSPEEIPLRY